MDFPVLFKKKHIFLAAFQFAYANSSMQVLSTSSKLLNFYWGFPSFI